MQGRSIVPVLKGKTPSNWRKEHYYHYYEYPGSHMVKRHYGMSTERYKIMHYYYDIDEWELYDLKTDPQEIKNVYNDPAYTSIKKNLHKRLLKLMKRYGDSEELAKSFLPNYSNTLPSKTFDLKQKRRGKTSPCKNNRIKFYH